MRPCLRRSGSRNRLDGRSTTSQSRTNSTLKINIIENNEATAEVKKMSLTVVSKFPALIQRFKRRQKKAGNLNSKDDESTQNFFPNFEEAFDFAKVREKILKLWWEDPGRDLTLEEVERKFGNLATRKVIRKRFDDLVKKGFINRKLYNPRKLYYKTFLPYLTEQLV